MIKVLGILFLSIFFCIKTYAEKINIYEFHFPDRESHEFQLFEKLISFNSKDYRGNEEDFKKAIKNIPFLCKHPSYSDYASLDDSTVLNGIIEILNNPNKKLYEFNFNFPNTCKSSNRPNGTALMPFTSTNKKFRKSYLSAVWVNRKKSLNVNLPMYGDKSGFPHYDIFLYRFLDIPIGEKTKDKLLKVSKSGDVNKKAFANIIQVLNNVEITQITQKKSKTSKTTKTKVNDVKITQQQQIEIEQIKEMLEIGAINKEEYDAAIKRVLN